jgi:hypothetical protein
LPSNLINAWAFGATVGKFASPVAYKCVDDLGFPFINAATKMIRKCINAENSTFSQSQKINDPKFFGGKLKSYFTSLGVIVAQTNDQMANQKLLLNRDQESAA